MRRKMVLASIFTLTLLILFWAIAVNERGEQNADSLNVYREAADGSERKSISFGNLSLNGYNQDLLFAPGGGRAIFSGYNYPQNDSGEQTENPSGMLLMLDISKECVTELDQGEFFRVLAWDADGENVLYMKDGSLIRRSLKDDKKITIAENSYYGTFSPDGKKIAYIQQKNGLWLCDTDGNQKTRLTTTIDDWYPVWYPDGQYLFFLNDLGQKLGDGAGHLQGMAKISIADGTVEKILPQKTGKFRKAEWIVPGRSLHVVSGWDDGFFHHIVDLTDGKIIDLGENIDNMNFTTDIDTNGGRLLKAGAGGIIQIYDASGHLQKSFNLAHSYFCWQYYNAAFTTDGNKILTMRRSTQTESAEPVERIIEVVDIENESAALLSTGSGNYEATFWEPSSGQVLVLERELSEGSRNLTNFTFL